MDAQWTHNGHTMDAQWTHNGRTMDAQWTHNDLSAVMYAPVTSPRFSEHILTLNIHTYWYTSYS